MDTISILYIPKDLRSIAELTGVSVFDFCDPNKINSEFSKQLSNYDINLIRDISNTIAMTQVWGQGKSSMLRLKSVAKYIKQNALDSNVLLNSSELDLSQWLTITNRGYDVVVTIADDLAYSLLTANNLQAIQPFYDYLLNRLFEVYRDDKAKVYNTSLYQESINNYIRLVKSGYETI